MNKYLIAFSLILIFIFSIGASCGKEEPTEPDYYTAYVWIHWYGNAANCTVDGNTRLMLVDSESIWTITWTGQPVYQVSVSVSNSSGNFSTTFNVIDGDQKRMNLTTSDLS
jgi:hypothetical protein